MKSIILCAGNNGRAVLFGNVEELPTKGEAVILKDARMVLRWPSECKGLLGLAANGPKGDTRLSPTVISTMETVWQEYIEVSKETAELISNWDK